jgi:hypothetical protein
VSQPKCSPCIDGCVDCNNLTACKKCGGDFYLANGICQCPAGFYADKRVSPVVCETCGGGCLSCTDRKYCAKCDTANNWERQYHSHCECKEAYFQKTVGFVTKTCEQCAPGCQKCYNQNVCKIPAIMWKSPSGPARDSSESARERSRYRILATRPTLAEIPQVLRDYFQSFEQRDPKFTQFSYPPSKLITMTGVYFTNNRYHSDVMCFHK